jgi:hypothetical protein
MARRLVRGFSGFASAFFGFFPLSDRESEEEDLKGAKGYFHGTVDCAPDYGKQKGRELDAPP